MANVYDVGQYITELVPTVDKMKLYKLCYFPKGGSSLGPVARCSRNRCKYGLTVPSLLLWTIEASRAAIPQT